MVTGFVIEKGYSGYRKGSMKFGVMDNEEMIKIAKSITVEELLSQTFNFMAERMDYKIDTDYLLELCEDYKNLPTEDLTCRFRMQEENGEQHVTISQSCSGGGRHRKYREEICEAFGFLFLKKAFEKGFAVNFGSY